MKPSVSGSSWRRTRSLRTFMVRSVRYAEDSPTSRPVPDRRRPDSRSRSWLRRCPRFRTLYGRRTNYWPTWLAAAAAAAALLFFQPPLVRGALEALPSASDGVTNLRAAANRQTDWALAELGVLQASLSFALEDRMDRLGDRLRDLERATRRRNEQASASATGPDGAPIRDPAGDIAP